MCNSFRGIFSLTAVVLSLALIAGCKSTQQPELAQPAPAAKSETPAKGQALKDELAGLKAKVSQLENETGAAKSPIAHPHPEGGEAPAAAEEAAPAQPAGDMSGILAAEEADSARRAQEGAALAEGYYREGRAFYEAQELEKSKQSLSRCLALAPQHEAAKRLLDDVRLLLGEYTSQDAGERVRKVMEEQHATAQQRKVELDNHFRRGVMYYETEEFGKAIEEFTWVVEASRWFPYNVDLSVQTEQAESYLKKSKEKKKLKDAELARKQEEAARKVAELEEHSRKTRVATQINQLFREAQMEFENKRFSRAEQLCDAILELDINNKYAHDLRDVAISARHAQTDRTNLETYLEEARRQFEAINRKQISQTEVVEFPPNEEWKRISDRTPRGIARAAKAVSPIDQQILNQMKEQKINLSFTDAPLTDVVAFLREFTGLNIIIDSQQIPTPADLRITLRVEDLPFDNVLGLIARMHNLAYKVEDGVVFVTTAETLQKETVLELYDVQDLTVSIPDFPGPEISLVSGDDGAAGAVATEAEQGTAGVTSEELQNLIKDNIAKGTWDSEGRSLVYNNGILIVRHTPDVQAKIQKFLTDVRSATGMIVTIEARFLQVQDHFLEDVGIDFRGLPTPDAFGSGQDTQLNVFRGIPTGVAGQPLFSDLTSGIFDSGEDTLKARIDHMLVNDQLISGFFQRVFSNSGGASLQYTLLDDVSVEAIIRAVRKDERSRTLTAPKITAFNNQRANIFFANQITYVKDYEIEIAQQAAIADPVPAVVMDGITLDVRPTISADRRYITLELRPTVAVLVDPISANVQVVDTVNAGIVIIETPHLRIQRLKTTVTIPDEGTILIGGLTSTQAVDSHADVPFINKIPIISTFFGRKAQGKQRSSLLILIRAKITLMEEEERKRH